MLNDHVMYVNATINAYYCVINWKYTGVLSLTTPTVPTTGAHSNNTTAYIIMDAVRFQLDI